MCHQTVRPTRLGQNQPSGDAPAAPAQGDTEPDPPVPEGDQNQDGGLNQETRSEAVAPDPTEQQEGMESFRQEDCGTQDQPAETHEDVQGLRFSSSGDFVGFASHVSSCSSGDSFSSHVLLDKTSHPTVNSEAEEVVDDSPLPLSPNAVNENTVEGQSDTNKAEFNVTFCPTEPRTDDREHESCVGTTKSMNGLGSPEANHANKSLEVLGVSLADGQTSVISCDESSELLGCIDNSHKNNGVSSDMDLDRLREAEAVPRRSSLSHMNTDATDWLASVPCRRLNGWSTILGNQAHLPFLCEPMRKNMYILPLEVLSVLQLSK